MINFSDSNINRMYLGNVPINKAYLCEVEVFPNTSIPTGESDYNDYVDINAPTNAGIYIDYNNNLGYKFETEVMFIEPSSYGYDDFQLFYNWGTYRGYLWIITKSYSGHSPKYELGVGNMYPSYPINSSNFVLGVRMPITVQVTSRVNGVNGVAKLIVNNNQLINQSNSQENSQLGNFILAPLGHVRYYWVKLYDHNDVLVRDLVPALSKGKYGLYDRLSKKFYTSDQVVSGNTGYHPFND